jgi:ABC-type multidrug transport system ATPase subunit
MATTPLALPLPLPPLLLLLLSQRPASTAAGCVPAGSEAYRVSVSVEDGNTFSHDAPTCSGHWSILRAGQVVLFGCKLPGTPLVFPETGAPNPHAVHGNVGVDACGPVDDATSCALSDFGDAQGPRGEKMLPRGTYTFVLQLTGCPYLGETESPYVSVDEYAGVGAGICDQAAYGSACDSSISIRISDAGMYELGLISRFNKTVTYGDGRLWGASGTDTDAACTVRPTLNCPPKGSQPGMRSHDVMTTLSTTFSVPLDSGSSALLPSSCQRDSDPRCYFRDPTVCNDNNASDTCPERCSPSCLAALTAMNNTDPPGCDLCNEDTISQFYRGEQGCFQATCDTDPEYQAGYCGTGTCPLGFFCPADFRCKIPCNPTEAPRHDARGRDEDGLVHYCPSPIPLPQPTRPCKLATVHGDVFPPIPPLQLTQGAGKCPGQHDPKETICPAGSMCDLEGKQIRICPDGHYCPPGTEIGKAKLCPPYADCPPGTDDICATDLKNAFGSCYIIHGLIFLSFAAVVTWLGWRIGSALKNRDHTKDDQARQTELERRAAADRQKHVERLSRRANPAHRRENSDDGSLLRRTFSDMMSDMEQVATASSVLIENRVETSKTPMGLLQSVDEGFNSGFASMREKWDEKGEPDSSSGGVGGRLAGLGAAVPPDAQLSEMLVIPESLLEGDVEGAGRKAAIDLKFSELSLTLKPPAPPTKILRGVTGELKAGRLTAIMGPSGAGKTSFLNVVSGKAGAYGMVGGQLLINGEEEEDGISKYKRSVGFVPQEDTMLREMTPKEILTFSARMRLPPDYSQKRITQLVDETLDNLNLWKIRHSPVGDEERRGISGGQRKRVNIGMELVADPSVLFLDEPTSGLDSTSSLEVCAILRGLAAKQGLNVTAVLHQPRYEIFELFHDVLLLGPGGVTVYLGPAEAAIEYFEHINPLYRVPQRSNPADFLMDLISGVECGENGSRLPADEQRAEQLAQKWVEHQEENGAPPGSPVVDRLRASEKFLARISSSGSSCEERTQHGDTPDPSPHSAAAEPQPEPEPEPEPEPAVSDASVVQERPVQRKPRSTWVQLQLFFWRGMSQSVRPPSKLIVDYGLIALMGLLIGVVFHNTNIQQLSASNNFTSMAVGFTTIQSSLRLFGNERVVFWREAASGASRVAYFLGKNLADLPRLLLVPAFYLCLFLGISGVHDNNLVRYWALLMGVWATSGIGYMASTLFSPRNAQLGGVSMTLVCCLVSGFFPTWPESSSVMRVVISCSYARWLNEALWVTDRGSYQAGGSSAGRRAAAAVKWGLEPGYVCVDPVRGPLWDVGACFTLNNYTSTPYAVGCADTKSDILHSMQCAFKHCDEIEGASCRDKGFNWEPVGGHSIAEITWALLGIGLASRFVAYLLLCGTHRSKQI